MTSEDARLWVAAEEFINKLFIPFLDNTKRVLADAALKSKTTEDEWRELKGQGAACDQLREMLVEGPKTAKAINAKTQ